MRLYNYFRVFLFLAFSLFSLFSHASDIYWSQAAVSGQQFSSASAACSAAVAQLASAGSINSGAYPIVGPVLGGPPSYYYATCKYNYTKTNGDLGCSTACSGLSNARTYGSCIAPDTFNSSTGECVPPAPPPDENPCSSKTGSSSKFKRAGSGGDGYYEFSGDYGSPSQDGCFGGCTANTADQKCTSNLKTLTYSCSGTMYYTGSQCSTSPAPEVDETTDTATPSPQAYSDYTPCQYTTNAQGVQVCVSSSTDGKEGQYCGTVNGVKTCIDSKPTQNGIEITTKVETTNNSDGSTTTTKTDTANSTKCSGFNACTSSSTTTTTTTNTNSDGQVISVSGSCTGPQCPDKNTNPDGNGDGFGDCIGDDCGGGSGGPFESPEFEEVATIAETTGAFLDRVESSPLLSTVSSIGLSGQGTCTMGNTNTSIGTISLDSFCDNSHWLDPLYFIFLAIHALAAVRVFLSA